MLTLFDFGVLVEIESILFCVHGIILASDLLRLRYLKPTRERPFKVPFGWVGAYLIVILPCLISLSLLVTSGWLNVLIGGLVILWGCVIYWISFVLLKTNTSHSSESDSLLPKSPSPFPSSLLQQATSSPPHNQNSLFFEAIQLEPTNSSNEGDLK